MSEPKPAPVFWPLHPDRRRIALELRSKTFEEQRAAVRGRADACPTCECWSLWTLPDGQGGEVLVCVVHDCRDSPFNEFMDE